MEINFVKKFLKKIVALSFQEDHSLQRALSTSDAPASDLHEPPARNCREPKSIAIMTRAELRRTQSVIFASAASKVRARFISRVTYSSSDLFGYSRLYKARYMIRSCDWQQTIWLILG
jgi:hypothetical protein